MKTDRFTNALLSIIALALFIMAWQSLTLHSHPVQAATTTSKAWEYKFIGRTFAWKNGRMNGTAMWKEDGKTLDVPEDGNAPIGAKIQNLGSQGWELIADTPYSWRMNTSAKDDMAANGVSTDELFIFKRQKP
jgi:hypothetical protein